MQMKLDGVDFVNGSSVDLSKDRTLTITRDGKDEEWTVKTPVISNNPVLPGQYADPDIDYFDGKFWIFLPQTDIRHGAELYSMHSLPRTW